MESLYIYHALGLSGYDYVRQDFVAVDCDKYVEKGLFFLEILRKNLYRC
ncbi:hypothetical protein [Maridesulfovibrio sp.]|nr:hypothetical protein [Maridesulfovibrio sp.]